MQDNIIESIKKMLAGLKKKKYDLSNNSTIPEINPPNTKSDAFFIENTIETEEPLISLPKFLFY